MPTQDERMGHYTGPARPGAYDDLLTAEERAAHDAAQAEKVAAIRAAVERLERAARDGGAAPIAGVPLPVYLHDTPGTMPPSAFFDVPPAVADNPTLPPAYAARFTDAAARRDALLAAWGPAQTTPGTPVAPDPMGVFAYWFYGAAPDDAPDAEDDEDGDDDDGDDGDDADGGAPVASHPQRVAEIMAEVRRRQAIHAAAIEKAAHPAQAEAGRYVQSMLWYNQVMGGRRVMCLSEACSQWIEFPHLAPLREGGDQPFSAWTGLHITCPACGTTYALTPPSDEPPGDWRRTPPRMVITPPGYTGEQALAEWPWDDFAARLTKTPQRAEPIRQSVPVGGVPLSDAQSTARALADLLAHVGPGRRSRLTSAADGVAPQVGRAGDPSLAAVTAANDTWWQTTLAERMFHCYDCAAYVALAPRPNGLVHRQECPVCWATYHVIPPATAPVGAPAAPEFHVYRRGRGRDLRYGPGMPEIAWRDFAARLESYDEARYQAACAAARAAQDAQEKRGADDPPDAPDAPTG